MPRMYHDVNTCPKCGGETTAGSFTPYIWEGEAKVDCIECLETFWWSFGYFDYPDDDDHEFKGKYYHF